ncbi:hypothetical protein BELL_1540g00010 [Botrytis elliptica]|uniref:Uncharacterized protein n=1 Tax=Botrytis elliptica TaxID=278938 RepID=A0A4Z1HYI6_9HELO|nr:hypothetical protein BELL_1540g00010 [Botrytis elliptica]
MIQSSPPSKVSYASVVGSNTTPISKPITISTQTSSFLQAQREIIVEITDAGTIESLRTKPPRNLQNHVDRAIEQSKNSHIEKIRSASANQLKSGDLSIKTLNRSDAEALKRFAEDWIARLGKGTSIRLPTYGILVHGIRISSMDMEKFDEIKAELLHDNRAFVPNADIKYIGWLSRAALTKSASTIIVEFTNPEDANKIIDKESAIIAHGSQRGRPGNISTGLTPSTPSLIPGRQNARSKSPTKGRATKRSYTGNTAESTQDENEDVIMGEVNQRSRRPHMPFRTALESTTTNSILSSQWNTEES